MYFLSFGNRGVRIFVQRRRRKAPFNGNLAEETRRGDGAGNYLLFIGKYDVIPFTKSEKRKKQEKIPETLVFFVRIWYNKSIRLFWEKNRADGKRDFNENASAANQLGDVGVRRRRGVFLVRSGAFDFGRGREIRRLTAYGGENRFGERTERFFG